MGRCEEIAKRPILGYTPEMDGTVRNDSMQEQLNNSQLSAISRLLSPSVFRELANAHGSPLFARLLAESSLLEYLDSDTPISEVFDAAFNYLNSKNNRREYIYKAALTHNVLLGKHSLSSAAMITEFRALGSKADVVIVNGTTTAYEIKTERDNLDRLPAQLSDYLKVFGKVNIITDERHADEVCRITDDVVGVMVLNNRGNITTIREPGNNIKNLDSQAVFDSLRMNENVMLLEHYGVDVPKVANTRLYSTLRPLVCALSNEELHHGMVVVLKKSRSLIKLRGFIELLPHSLQAIALTTKINIGDRGKIVETLKTPASVAMRWN